MSIYTLACSSLNPVVKWSDRISVPSPLRFLPSFLNGVLQTDDVFEATKTPRMLTTDRGYSYGTAAITIEVGENGIGGVGVCCRPRWDWEPGIRGSERVRSGARLQCVLLRYNRGKNGGGLRERRGPLGVHQSGTCRALHRRFRTGNPHTLRQFGNCDRGNVESRIVLCAHHAFPSESALFDVSLRSFQPSRTILSTPPQRIALWERSGKRHRRRSRPAKRVVAVKHAVLGAARRLRSRILRERTRNSAQRDQFRSESFTDWKRSCVFCLLCPSFLFRFTIRSMERTLLFPTD